MAEEEKNLPDLSDMPDTLQQANYIHTIHNLPVVQILELPETLIRAVNLATGLMSGPVWLGEQLRGYLGYELKKRFEFKEPEEIQQPDPSVVGPLIESLKFNLHRPELRSMYLNLLETSMDKDQAQAGHPAFVKIIEQMVPDEAKILRYLATHGNVAPIVDLVQREKDRHALRYTYRKNLSLLPEQSGCEFETMSAGYLDNLCRMGITEIPQFEELNDTPAYEKLEGKVMGKAWFDDYSQLIEEKEELAFNRKLIQVTSFGKQFERACVFPIDDD